ncbi:MAG: DUF1624 domain-containing protein [Methylobacteriaceae bacterium]|nr:DUF1624 domain-containing protein [Methylobacteriaceae bacterium]
MNDRRGGRDRQTRRTHSGAGCGARRGARRHVRLPSRLGLRAFRLYRRTYAVLAGHAAVQPCHRQLLPVYRGLSLALARRRPFDWRAYGMRLAVIVSAAALVTAASWLLFPDALIFFGILHCIAAASLLALPFVFLPWPAALAGGALAVALPQFVASRAFDPPALMWTGLGIAIPASNDFRPLLPWAGALLFGLAAGLAMRNRGGFNALARISGTSAPARLLAFGGRHSLAIYLVHQPVFFALLTASVWAFGSPAPSDERPFRQACERECAASGPSIEKCRHSCACTAQTFKRLNLWNKMRAGQLDAAEQTILSRVARNCLKP